MKEYIDRFEENEINVGDLVEFAGKDSYYKGFVVSIFHKKDNENEIRCVVEDDRGLLLIKHPDKAKKIKQ